MKLLFSFLFALSINLYSNAQNADIDLLKEINLNRHRNLDGTFKFLSASVTPASIAAPLLVSGMGFIKKDSTIKRKGFVIGASILSATIIATTLKYTVNRTRPFVTYPLLDPQAHVTSPSFPSGHTSAAFCTATSLSIQFPKWYVIAPAYLWAGASAFSRMHLGVHYPSDVLAGALIGSGSAYLCHLANKWLSRKGK